MSEEQTPPAADDAGAEAVSPQQQGLDFQGASLAYSIIQNLLEHARVLSDLVALMAQVLDQDTTESLTQTPHWSAYLDSRRALEQTRADIEKFTDIMRQLGEGESS